MLHKTFVWLHYIDSRKDIFESVKREQEKGLVFIYAFCGGLAGSPVMSDEEDFVDNITDT